MVTATHHPLDTRIFHKEAKVLRDAGYKVTLLAPGEQDQCVEGIVIHVFPKLTSRAERMFLGPWRILRRCLSVGADVYHLHEPELILGGFILKLLGRRVVYDAHEDLPAALLSRAYLQKFIRKPLSWITSLILKSLPFVFDSVVLSGNELLGSFGSHQRTVLVRNYPVWSVFAKAPIEKRSPGKFTLIYAGGIRADRGITQLVQALAYLRPGPQVKLLLFGEFTPQEYQAELSELKHFEQVEYLGWVEHPVLVKHLLRADIGLVCLHPTQKYLEALPVKLFEYMAAAIPVVVSHFPIYKEIVDGHQCGLMVDPLNPMEIGNAIQYLIENPEERRRMGINGRKAVRKHYNWQNEADRLIELYGNLLPHSEERTSLSKGKGWR